jgi:hypothetical protein
MSGKKGHVFGTSCCGSILIKPSRTCPCCERTPICTTCARCQSCLAIINDESMTRWLREKAKEWFKEDIERRKRVRWIN